jgi:hypothetical protein
MTLLALSSSCSRRAFSLRNRANSRSRGSAPGRPTFWVRAMMASRSRCLRHWLSRELYSPSLRNSAPLPALFSPS